MPLAGPRRPRPFRVGPHVGAALGTASSRCSCPGRAMETGYWLLGGEFEDSVFEERRERRPGPLASYRAKLCEPQVRKRGLSASSQPPGLALPGPGPTALQRPKAAWPTPEPKLSRHESCVHADSLVSLPLLEPQPAGPGPLCPRGNPRAVAHQLVPGVRPASRRLAGLTPLL